MAHMARSEIPPPPLAQPGSEQWYTQEHDRLANLEMLQPTERCFYCGKPLPCDDLVYWAGHDRQIRLHARSAAVSPDGAVYAPAAIAGDELKVTMCAQWDGVDPVADSVHVYLPVSWLRGEYPDLSDVLDLIERKAKERSAEG